MNNMSIANQSTNSMAALDAGVSGPGNNRRGKSYAKLPSAVAMDKDFGLKRF